MKGPVLLGLWVAALGASLACAGQRRSDDFVCTRPSDCADGRDCVDGFCVTGGGGGADAAARDGAGACPPQCTSCQAGVCRIVCADADCGAIVCPAGMACDVTCTGSSACMDGVDCSRAASCQVACIGPRACQNGVECGQGPCDVTCTGDAACDDGVDCSDACRCQVVCSGRCAIPASCPDLDCETPQDGCSAQPAADCDTCP